MIVRLEKNSDKISSKCANCEICSHSFCGDVSIENIRDFPSKSVEKCFCDKTNIFLQQEYGQNLYNLTSGNVKIYNLLTDGRVQIIGFLYPGDFFGAFNNNIYKYSADATGDVKTCVFDRKNLEILVSKDVSLANGLLRRISHELNLAQERISVLGRMRAVERISAFLINVSNQRVKNGWPDNPISLPMGRQDIADYLGLTIETVSRSFRYLKSKNIIKMIDKNKIYILDKSKLEYV